MNVFITGGSGRLGSYLCTRAVQKGWEVSSSYFSHPVQLSGVSFFSMDLASGEEVQRILGVIRPSKIIHCAAIAREDTEENLTAVNVRGTGHLCDYCRETGAWIGYISTDLVFDGMRGMYREDDLPGPSGLYPSSKLSAEELVLKSGVPASILRIPINYGWSREHSTFVEWIIKNVQQGQKVPLFVDQFRSPVYLSNLADTILEIAGRELTGIFHLAGPERISRYDFGLKAARILGFPAELLSPVRMSEMSFSGSHCSDCSLDVGKARQVLQTGLLGIDEGLMQLREEKSRFRMSLP